MRGRTKLRIFLTNTPDPHAVTVTPGDARYPLAELVTTPFELVVGVPEFTGCEIKERVVFSVRRRQDNNARAVAFEYGALHRG